MLKSILLFTIISAHLTEDEKMHDNKSRFISNLVALRIVWRVGYNESYCNNKMHMQEEESIGVPAKRLSPQINKQQKYLSSQDFEGG